MALPVDAIPATLDGAGTLNVDATVRATGDAEGDVVFAPVAGPGRRREIAGAWDLDGTDLQVDMTSVEASSAMAGGATPGRVTRRR